MRKRQIAWLLVVIMLCISACEVPLQTGDKEAEASVLRLIESKEQSVRQVDLKLLLSTLDPGDRELQREQTNWLKDIGDNPIEAYSLKLLRLERISDGLYKAKLRQEYSRGDKRYSLDYYNKYRLEAGQMVDAGNYSEVLQKGNITIHCAPSARELARDSIQSLNELYQENIARWQLTPERPLVIKMFEDVEELRQSIKLSMWQCGGWYEYGESVKILTANKSRSKAQVLNVVGHEMTHLFTGEKAGGNLAYWFSEGLATYYEGAEGQQSPRALAGAMNVRLLTIDELEGIELEKLQDPEQISNYYNNAHIIIAYIIENYGEEKVMMILDQLKKKPSFNGTTSQNDPYYRAYLSEILPRVLGMKSYKSFKEQWKREISKL
jgi:hypothetical protein